MSAKTNDKPESSHACPSVKPAFDSKDLGPTDPRTAQTAAESAGWLRGAGPNSVIPSALLSLLLALPFSCSVCVACFPKVYESLNSNSFSSSISFITRVACLPEFSGVGTGCRR